MGALSTNGKTASEKAVAVVQKLQSMKLGQAAKIVENGFRDTLTYYHFPQQHWCRRRTRVVGAFPDGESAVMLVAARLRHVGGTKWGERVYLDMKVMEEAAVA